MKDRLRKSLVFLFFAFFPLSRGLAYDCLDDYYYENDYLVIDMVFDSNDYLDTIEVTGSAMDDPGGIIDEFVIDEMIDELEYVMNYEADLEAEMAEAISYSNCVLHIQKGHSGCVENLENDIEEEIKTCKTGVAVLASVISGGSAFLTPLAAFPAIVASGVFQVMASEDCEEVGQNTISLAGSTCQEYLDGLKETHCS